MATHSSIDVWRIPWTKEPGRLQSMGSQRVGHHLATKPPVNTVRILSKSRYIIQLYISYFFLRSMHGEQFIILNSKVITGLHSGCYEISTCSPALQQFIILYIHCAFLIHISETYLEIQLNNKEAIIIINNSNYLWFLLFYLSKNYMLSSNQFSVFIVL